VNKIFSLFSAILKGAIPRESNFVQQHLWRRIYPTWILPLAMLAQTVLAQAQFNYSTNNGTITITQYTGVGGAVTIPDTIDGLSVTSIGDDAFSGFRDLTEVTIPNSITNIGNRAFDTCSSLVDLTIGENVLVIGDYAFAWCTSLSKVVIPANVTNIGSRAFYSCVNLSAITVNLSNAVYSSLDGVLFDKNQTTLIEYPAGGAANYVTPSTVTGIRAYAFLGCTNLMNFVAGQNVTNIGPFVFLSCSGVTNVTLDTAVATIEEGVFGECSNLTSLIIPDGVTSIGHLAFGFCSKLANVSIGTNVTGIANYAFRACTSLTNIVIPGSVTSLGPYAFENCSNLAIVTIGSGVTNIGDWAFLFCPMLIAETVDPQNHFYSSVDGVLFDKSQASLIQYPEGLAGNYSIPDFVTNVAPWAFAATRVAGIKIPGTVGNIGPVAFTACESLTNVTIASGIIGSGAFSSCSNLANVTIGDGVPIIGDGAFESCPQLTVIRIPASVTNIGPGAFSNTGLIAISVDATNPVYSSVSGVLFNESQTTLIQYPGGLIEDYSIPQSVTNIEQRAFTGASLVGVRILGRLGSIQDDMFMNCSNLAKVTIDDGVTNIGVSAFQYCTRLSELTLPDSVTSIGYEAFMNCIALSNLTLSANLTSLGDYAFAGCSGLGRLVVPDSITNMGFNSFDGCTGLKSLTIGTGIQNLGVYTFASCTNLGSVYFKGNAPSIDPTVFMFENPTLYYLPRTTGWSSRIDGLPAVLWNPQIQTSDGSFGVRGNEFGFNIIGTIDIPIAIEICTNLAIQSWAPRQNFTLTNGLSYFSDPQWTNYPDGFYRIRFP
jgi:hypothetical protein